MTRYPRTGHIYALLHKCIHFIRSPWYPKLELTDPCTYVTKVPYSRLRNTICPGASQPRMTRMMLTYIFFSRPDLSGDKHIYRPTFTKRDEIGRQAHRFLRDRHGRDSREANGCQGLGRATPKKEIINVNTVYIIRQGTSQLGGTRGINLIDGLS